MAPTPAEPQPPGGVGEADLYRGLVAAHGETWARAFWKWLTTSWPEWGRAGWGRVDTIRMGCGP